MDGVESPVDNTRPDVPKLKICFFLVAALSSSLSLHLPAQTQIAPCAVFDSLFSGCMVSWPPFPGFFPYCVLCSIHPFLWKSVQHRCSLPVCCYTSFSSRLHSGSVDANSAGIQTTTCQSHLDPRRLPCFGGLALRMCHSRGQVPSATKLILSP